MYYGYIRVSTSTQSEKGGGLDVQRGAIEKYAKDNGIELAEIFCDAGISGTKESRPELDRLLLETIQEGDTIIVHNTSRLWRSLFAQATVMKAVENAKANIKSIDEPNFDLYLFQKDPENFMICGMMGMLDQWERMTIARKLARGRTSKANKGDKPSGVAPYGYRYTADKKHIEPDPEEAQILRRIFSEAQKGMSLEKIASGLNNEGIKTRRGCKWQKGNLSLLLRNNFYTGIVTHQGKEIPGNHEPLISRIQYGKVQAQLKRNRH
jgi:DNA invertase Pin-like site-specific DNA recombinase